jgi:RNA polymerase sigma-70 factor (ECF subfamily)
MDKPFAQTTQLQLCLDRFRSGDDAARDQMIEFACERVRRMASSMLRDHPAVGRWEQTDDVLQHVLIRLHRALADVKPQNVRAFLGLAAQQIRWTLIDLARHHMGPMGQGRHHHTAGGGKAADDRGQPLHTHADNEPRSLEEWTEFHECVAKLPDDEREVFDLLWYEGVTQVEAAEVLEVNERTVRRRWISARRQMYELLQGNHPA